MRFGVLLLTNCFSNELGGRRYYNAFHILDFCPAYRRDLTRLSARCRNHPRTLGQAPLAAGRNKRNKRTRGVCVTLLYAYAGACEQARDGLRRRESVGKIPKILNPRRRNVPGNSKSPIVGDEPRSVDRPIPSTNRTTPAIFISRPYFYFPVENDPIYLNKMSSARCFINHPAEITLNIVLSISSSILNFIFIHVSCIFSLLTLDIHILLFTYYLYAVGSRRSISTFVLTSANVI